MKRYLNYFLVTGFVVLFASTSASAMPSDVVISHVQAGAASGVDKAATQEFIAVYNNSAEDIEVTDWCVSNKSEEPFFCLTPKLPNQVFYLGAHSHMILISNTYQLLPGEYQIDGVFPLTHASSGSITASGDIISLLDADHTTIDQVSWGNDSVDPGDKRTLGGGDILQRNVSPGSDLVLVDRGMSADFNVTQEVALPSSGVYDAIIVIDVCANIVGVQTIPLESRVFDADGNCIERPEIDSCLNLVGFQVEVPVGYIQDEAGDCYQDSCTNIEGLQIEVPTDFIRHDTGECVYDTVVLHITELLPNASGGDGGREFIELYNPGNRVADLAHYKLQVGGSNVKLYDFPTGATIAPGQYKAFYNSEIPFTLVNTTGQVVLMDNSEAEVSRTMPYETPKDDQAWALIDHTWQYTNQPTSGESNKVMVAREATKAKQSSQVKPCAANQYRHPETNRCRLLVTATSRLQPCAATQYRSPETNRCRNITIASSKLTPCKANQYRHSETNRCRNIVVASSTLKPCDEGQYRSEETNRCRKIATPAVLGSSTFAVEPIADTRTAFVGWWALGGVAALALGYGVWEWRRELAKGAQKIVAFMAPRK